MKDKNTFDNNYKGNEYLQIYPRIEYRKAFSNILGSFFKEGYYVREPNTKGTYFLTELSVWLKS